MRRLLLLLLLFLALLFAPSVVRYLRFYGATAVDRDLPQPFDPAAVAAVATPPATSFVDEPEVGDGFVLLDQAHNNDFTLDEIGYLDGRLSQRGFELRPYESGDELSTALRAVNAFIVIAPLRDFTTAEIRAVSDFVARGGRLLMVGDPTRFDIVVEEDEFEFNVFLETDKIPLNSLANEFDIIFNGDYLYNTTENEGNFRNIILRESGFAEGNMTDGLTQVVFYGSHSLQVGPTATPLLAGDDNTWSSATDRPGGLTLAASSVAEQVLALGDIGFMTAPYYTVYDNGRFIAHIADFLTGTAVSRDYVLADFPFFYGEDVSLVYAGAPQLGPDAFDEIIQLQEAFREAELDLTLAAAAPETGDALILGLYNQADDVEKLLEAADVTLTINPPLTVPDESDEDIPADDEDAPEQIALVSSSLGNVQMSGTALILLDEAGGMRTVTVLAASGEGLESAVNRLLAMLPLSGDNALADCLLQDSLALCPTGVDDEPVEAELLTGGAPDTAVADPSTTDEEDAAAPDDAADPGDDQETDPEESGQGPDDAVDQGEIALGTSESGTLGEDEIHSWTFSGGPAVIDIVLEGGEDLDAVLALFDENGDRLETADDSFTEGTEQISGVDVPADVTYTILISDFFEDGGAYTLTVSESDGEADAPGSGIFIFVDDNGTPLNDGQTSAEALAAQLDAYDVTVWVSSEDGSLADASLSDYALVVWDSGDYQNEEGFLSDDTAVLVEYVDGGGDILITGSAPTILPGFELAVLSEVEVAGEDATLLNGLNPGDVIELDQPYNTVLSEFFEEDQEDGSIGFFVRTAGSEGAGSIVGLAGPEDEFNNQKTLLLLFPFAALPADVQATLMGNMLDWFELTP